ncbi:MAG TPA: MBL fold metallo-hydrolase [Candidatus Sulfotelmatobacter sp.]|jgi:hydroxyacylglutathione hydrolase|nr:MBL fold metallo-hydrolase [Candidatus Sulfotelmatobacter sp.]
MQLEDHLGDIIRKIRKASNISVATAAAAAGVSEKELAALEDTGKTSAKVNFIALARTIGLDGKKLEGIAGGYLPSPKDLPLWRGLRVFTSAADDFTVNCFLVWDEVTREAALFDTGMDSKPVLDCIAAEKLELRHIFITHSHWDHVEALPKFRAAFSGAKIHSGSKSAPVDQRNKNDEVIHLGGLQITHRETPGHADDGVTYLISNWQKGAPQVAIVGDTIFAGSMGNGNGHWEIARQKIREQILTLPPDTLICPGHGPLTTVGEEKANNPFF